MLFDFEIEMYTVSDVFTFFDLNRVPGRKSELLDKTLFDWPRQEWRREEPSIPAR